ncbi:MAG: aminomethyl-transferring glycine dehydrogenase subunit GcvPB [Rhodospirillales bacterium]|jgi:glycine dehydrogenase subunit 2|nr:aminomethyl-transferring glycine dehydrogenase subunit GcvPB [Rhodospirillales bacterium]
MSDAMATFSGNRGLQMEQPLIFEQGSPDRTAVDLPDVPAVGDRLGGLKRQQPVGLPGLSEPEVVRHYTRLSQKNYCIDSGLYPLGSCTMKHNPRLNEKLARLPGIGDLHPLQPVSTAQGALMIIDACARWLMALTGMPAVAMSPGAGAHGEFVGMAAIRAAHEDRGDARRRVLVPESAHGTNPATAVACGYAVEPIPANRRGRVDIGRLRAALAPDVAAIMVTNPNTCGLFETDILDIAAAAHDVGAYFYCDGANFNAIVGRVRPGDLGVDAMHINLHKTFSTPHGGGGPGSGPVVLSAALAPYAPVPYVVNEGDGLSLVEYAAASDGKPCGRIKGFHGQFGMFVRALAYMMSMGSDGLKQAATDAVINANYVMARLKDVMTPSFDGPCMHEALFDDRFLKGSEITTLDFAKALIDEGYHPMTVYFPLIVPGAMLIEPTETESRQSLDRFIDVMRALAARAVAGDAERFRNAPRFTPRRRLDETSAARHPVLRWRTPAVDRAAE